MPGKYMTALFGFDASGAIPTMLTPVVFLAGHPEIEVLHLRPV